MNELEKLESENKSYLHLHLSIHSIIINNNIYSNPESRIHHHLEEKVFFSFAHCGFCKWLNEWMNRWIVECVDVDRMSQWSNILIV